jgi:alpha-1,3-mannosyl-glycoprotein beta-1,2-N-acetylglucosaminyltransferase
MPLAATRLQVIILEEGLEIAPDFFDYFDALASLFNSDLTLMLISAFNANGMSDRVRDPAALFRCGRRDE